METKLMKEVFQDIHSKKPSTLYMELCQLFPIEPIADETLYEQTVKIVRALVRYINLHEKDGDAMERNMVADLRKYVSALAVMVQQYEVHRFPEFEKGATGRDVLAFLMEQHGLSQRDLAKEIGGQSVVSDILKGARKLNLRQIQALSKRFNVSPIAFFRE